MESPAKVNLFLSVTGVRADGYHDLATVFQAVEWTDRLRVTKRARPGISLTVTERGVPADARNLVWRAWERLATLPGVDGGIDAALDKHLPHGAGLGGGSGNAAALLVAVDALFDLRLGAAALEAIGAAVGADVPFFVRGGTQLGTGRGDTLEPLDPLTVGAFGIATPPFRLDTARVYAKGGFELTPNAEARTLLGLGIAREDPEGVARGLVNALEGPAFSLRPELKRLKGQLLATPALGALLCGSGSSVFAYYGDEAEARARLRDVPGATLHVAMPRPTGVRRVE